MDVFVLAGLAVLAIPVGLIWLAVSHVRLSDRVRMLERRLAEAARPTAEILQSAEPVATTVAPSDDGAAAPPPVPERADAPAAAATQGTVWAAAARPPQAALHPHAPDWAARLGAWLRENWVYAVAALSLAAAGVFLVQYGMERGLLPPGLRVLAGMAFGAALIAVGEYLRRRFGDGDDQFTAYLPQVFCGAGLVSAFAALLAGRLLYGMFSPESTFAGLLLIALAAMVLGWLHGPLLAALGLLGAAASPFLLGGGSVAPAWLMVHYLIVGALGLGIDTLRRWGWVSVLALVLAYLGGLVLMAAGAGEVAYLLLAFALPVLAMAIPARGIFPDQGGPSALEFILTKGAAVPPFPMKLAMGSMLVSGIILALLPVPDQGADMLAFGLAAGMVVFLLLWADRTPALHDLALIPAAAFLARLLAEGAQGGPIYRSFREAAIALRAPDIAAPITITVLMALAALIGAALALRSKRGTGHPVIMAATGAALMPVAAMAAEFLWQPALTIGAYPWALHVIAMAALMVGIAAMMARLEPADPRRRTAHAVLSAIILIALALFILTTKTALTLALAVLVVAAAMLDRRFRLREMEWAVMAGVTVIGWRLSVDPGLFWALDAPLMQVVPSYLGPVIGFAAAIWGLRGMARPAGLAFLESGLAAALALLVDILLVRWLDDGRFFVLVSTLALPWLILAQVQLYRLRLGGVLRWVRIALGAVAGTGAVLALVAVAVFNPVVTGETLSGPLVLDTLFVAYLLPALVLVLSHRVLTHLPKALRYAITGFGAALAALYAILEIRRFWRGDDLSVYGTSQPELYTYTVALLLLGAALLWRAIATGSQSLRRVAMGVIGVTAAKVFLIDASGLTGLMRVFSFLALGLSLAGLAALNRWAASRSGPDRTPPL